MLQICSAVYVIRHSYASKEVPLKMRSFILSYMHVINNQHLKKYLTTIRITMRNLSQFVCDCLVAQKKYHVNK